MSFFVILSSYQFFYCSRVDAKAFGWASMIPLSHFAQGGQVKCLPKKQVIIKVSHSVVAEGTVCGGGEGRGAKAVRHNRNFCNFFNYPLAQQSCGGDIGSVPYVCM